MGLLEKAIAYRWATQGRGGGGEGMNPLVLIMIVIVGFALVMLAIQAVLAFIYNTIRSLLLPFPTVGAIVMGFLIAGIAIVLISPSSPDRAAKLLQNEDSKFKTKAIVSLVTFSGFIIGMLAGPIPEPGEANGIPIPSFVLIGLFCYFAYYIYRTNKLVGAAPNGTRYRLATFLPLSIAIAAEGFNLPVSPILTIYNVSVVTAFLLMTSPLLIGLAVVVYRLEPALENTDSTTEQPTDTPSSAKAGHPDQTD